MSGRDRRLQLRKVAPVRCLPELLIWCSLAGLSAPSGLAVQVGAAATATTTPAAPRAVDARAADAFVDSIGVNVHLTYADTTYADYESVIKPRLRELGVRHLRDGCQRDNTTYYQRIRELGEVGMRFSLIADARAFPDPAQLSAVVAAAGPALLQLEGPNEPDVGEPGWEARTRDYQARLYKFINGDPASAHLAVAAPSLANSRDAASQLGDLGHCADYANLHTYPGGNHPGSESAGGWGISLDAAIERGRRVCPKGRVITTETGYHNNVVRGLHRGVSEAAAGKLLPRLLCASFMRGVARTYVYELADERPDRAMSSMENHFGLIRADGVPKPAFTAIAGLIRLLRDPGPGFTPGRLRFTVTGDTTDLQHLLLQKRDGRFYLLIWNEVASYDLKGNVDVVVPERACILRLDEPASVTVHRLGSTDSVVHLQHRTSEVELKLADAIRVVEITVGARK